MASPVTACELDHGVARVVARVELSGTLVLDDGSQAVLAGIVTPSSGLMPLAGAAPWQPLETTRRALAELVEGKSVELATAGRRIDRYGRQIVHAFVTRGDERLWLQAALVDGGLARAYGLPGNLACVDLLLAHERLARSRLLGHWATGVFKDGDVADVSGLFAARDSFQTLTGTIASVRFVRGQTVVAFAPGGLNSFQAVIMSDASSVRQTGTRNSGASRMLRDMVGQRVRVRGWVEVRRHLQVQLSASLIEQLGDPASPAPSDDPDEGPPALPLPIPVLIDR